MTLTELFTNIADAIRAKTGSTEPIKAEDFPSAIEAIETGGKTTKTIYIDWSGDEEGVCYVNYISNGQYKYVSKYDEDVIEAEGGVVNGVIADGYYSDNFIPFGGVMIATQDGETIYPISSSEL